MTLNMIVHKRNIQNVEQILKKEEVLRKVGKSGGFSSGLHHQKYTKPETTARWDPSWEKSAGKQCANCAQNKAQEVHEDWV